jgi:hypothetical protein
MGRRAAPQAGRSVVAVLPGNCSASLRDLLTNALGARPLSVPCLLSVPRLRCGRPRRARACALTPPARARAARPRAAGVQALMAGASAGDAAAIAAALATRAPVNSRNAAGESALQLAAGSGSTEAVAALMQAGAVVEGADKTGMTALHAAAASGQVGCVTALLTAGADVNARTKGQLLALHYGAKGGFAPVCKALLDAGSEVEKAILARGARCGASALPGARRMHHGACVLTCVRMRRRAPVDCAELDQGGAVPLHDPAGRRCAAAHAAARALAREPCRRR